MMKILLSIFLTVVFLFAGDFNFFLNTMKQKQEMYQDENKSNTAREELIKKYNFPSEQNVTKEHEALISTMHDKSLKIIDKSIPWITENMLKGIDKKEIKNITDLILNRGKKIQDVDTIFYLFSTSQNSYALYNFVSNASLLEAVNPSIKYYGVVQGLLNKKELDELYKPFKFKEDLNGKAVIKMQPFIFKDLELKRVPAYLFSKCSSGQFKYKDCDNKYLVRGDISLQQALEIVSKEDKSYLKYLNLLERGDY